MDQYTVARVVHVVGVVLWIGGVAMVTTVLLPAIRRMKSSENPVELFEKFQTKFAMQARIASLLTGASGFYMLYYLEAWEWYTDPEFWWLHATTVLWVLFTIVLFVLEPLVLHRLYKEKGATNPVKTLAIAHRLHAVLLALSLLTLAVSVAGTHGWISS
jgi:uncharacterized membrane protein